jgi:hypothetical protein
MRAAAAALCLAAVAAAESANAAQTRAPFQQTAILGCGGGNCRADFIDLPNNQALDIEHVWCELFTSGTVWRGQVYALPISPYFIIPLDLQWQRSHGATKGYTFGAEMSMRVPLGKQFTALINYDGVNPTGFCSFTGIRITNN